MKEVKEAEEKQAEEERVAAAAKTKATVRPSAPLLSPRVRHCAAPPAAQEYCQGDVAIG